MKRAPSQEEMMEQVQKILEERGRKALEMTRKTVLEEEIECKEVGEALKYFITEYWHDLARPALLSLCCEAVGGDPEVTITVAIPMSLISGGIDIHDDIIDQSEIKRSRPTVLGKFGKDIALLVGDALIFKGLALLHEAAEKGVPPEKIQVVSGIIKRMFFELGDAEALELQFRGRMDVTPEAYLRVVRKKAADVEAHTRISAILGSGSKEEIEALGEYGRLLGMMIILRDDLIDMIDLEEARHRIRKECLPLPLLYALQDPKAKLEISSFLQRKKLTKSIVEKILKIIYEAQGFEHSMKIMEEMANGASIHLRKLKQNRANLNFLVRCMVLPVV
jgi:geranylgeranyl diphosphate synthase type I